MLLAAGLAALAQERRPAGIDPTEIPLESLFNMEVTTASKFPEKLPQAPGAISVVTRDELRRFGAMTLREALERVPGLTSATGYFTDRSMVAVRGDEMKDNGSHVLILINGRPAREIMDGGGVSDLMESFPVNVLERIEVIRGPGSVLYGTNAFSGVINLITRKPGGNSATVRSWSVKPGAGGVSGELMMQRGALSIVAAGQARFDPLWKTGYRYEFPGTGAFSSPLVFERISIRDRGPGAFVDVNYKGLRVMGSFTEWQSAYFAGPVVGENRWRRGFTNVGYSKTISPKWDMNLDLTHTIARLGSSTYPYARQSGSDTVLEWSNVLRPRTQDQITFGALVNYVQGSQWFFGTQPETRVSDGSRLAGAFYAQIDHRLTGQLKVVGGVQSNKIGPLHLSTVPRAGLVWSPSGRIHFKALYGRAFRAPSINETTLVHPDVQGNPALAPERVGTFDAGITYQSNRFLAGINFFDSRTTGIIAVDSTLNPVRYANGAGVHLRGGEFETKWYASERWFVFATLVYSNSYPVRLPSPRWTVSHGVSYQARKSFTLTASDVYRSASSSQAGVNPLASPYHLVNAHARLALAPILGSWARNLALFAHGVNLGNREIWLPAFGNASFTVPFERRRTLYYGMEVALFRE